MSRNALLRVIVCWFVVVQGLAYIIMRANLTGKSGNAHALYRAEVCGPIALHRFDIALPARYLACYAEGYAP